MQNKTTHFEDRKMAMVAGFSLVTMALLAGVAFGYAFQKVYVPGDGAATLLSLNASPSMLRLVILGFLGILILDVIVAWALYYFFMPVSKPVSSLTAAMRLVYTIFLGIALSSLVGIMHLLNSEPQNEVAVMQQFKTFLEVWSLGLIVFGGHLLLLGYLMVTSGYVPKALGILTLVASVCYIFTNIANILLPDYEQYKATVELVLSLPMALGELALAFWLIVKGGKRKQLITFQDSLPDPA